MNLIPSPPDLQVISSAQSEAGLGASYRTEAEKIANSMVELMRRAQKDDFVIEFQIAKDQYGKSFIGFLHVMKRY
jgi:hypothetical protein